MNESCWIPTQKPKPDGYVQICYYKGKKPYLHRVIYETLVGPIREGLFLDHLCKERSCCNPAHLEQVTNQENIRRGDTGKHQSELTHCPANHEYNESNTYKYRNMRFCRKCRTLTQQRYLRRLQNV